MTRTEVSAMIEERLAAVARALRVEVARGMDTDRVASAVADAIESTAPKVEEGLCPNCRGRLKHVCWSDVAPMDDAK